MGGSVGSGTGAWTYAARMRYRYDGANQRTVKESFEASGINTASRVALSIYPGDFERRGLLRNTTTYDAVTTGVDATETQYMVAGARIVWDASTSATLPNLDRNRRVTYALTDLLQTSGAVVDLVSGELLELSTYYPNGARENLWASDSNAPLEPTGFTGKEADEDIGLTYFGERWLMPRLGRWASPDPLHVHASGGGEALNSYHYVSGNLLQARDPDGLRVFIVRVEVSGSDGSRAPSVNAAETRQAGIRDVMGTVRPGERRFFRVDGAGEVHLTRAGSRADRGEFSPAAARLARLVENRREVVLLAPARSSGARYEVRHPITHRAIVVNAGPHQGHVGGQTWRSPEAVARQAEVAAATQSLSGREREEYIANQAANPRLSTQTPETTVTTWSTELEPTAQQPTAQSIVAVDHELREHVERAIEGTHDTQHTPGYRAQDAQRLREIGAEFNQSTPASPSTPAPSTPSTPSPSSDAHPPTTP